MKILLIYILLFALVNYSSCCIGNPNTKEDCINQATSYSRCCYNGDTRRCLSLGSNRLVDYYKLLKRENTNNHFAHRFGGDIEDLPLILVKTTISFYRILLNDFRSFHSLFKVLFIFPSQYLFAIGLPSIFSFRRFISPA